MGTAARIPEVRRTCLNIAAWVRAVLATATTTVGITSGQTTSRILPMASKTEILLPTPLTLLTARANAISLTEIAVKDGTTTIMTVFGGSKFTSKKALAISKGV